MEVENLSVEKAKSRLRRCRIFGILGAVFLLISLGATIVGGMLKNTAYNNFVSISPATDITVRKETYIRAIKLYPERTDAYLLLLDTYNEDGSFSQLESEEFLNIYNSNHTQIKKRDKHYAELHYTVGFMYINGYDAASSTRLRMALPFFETAKEYIAEEDPMRLAVNCYCQIGDYYENYIWDASANVREVNTQQLQALITEIQTMLVNFQQDTSADAIFNFLGFSTAVCNLFYDQRDILAGIIPEEDVWNVIDEIYNTLPSEQALQKEQTRQLLQTLKENEEIYRDALTRAYQRKDGK